jgi:hypothetical protein
MDLNKLKADPEMERGVWVALDPTCEIKIAYTGSRDYQKALKRRLKPYADVLSRTRDVDVIPDTDQEAISVEMIVEHVLLDWKGVVYNGQSLPYSKSAANLVLTEVPMFRAMVEEKAAQVSNFRDEQRKVDAKNLETASAGA